MPAIVSFPCSLVWTPYVGEVLEEGLRQGVNASSPNPGWLPSGANTSGDPLSINFLWKEARSLSEGVASSIEKLRLEYFLSFFDSLVSDLPAIPTNYDGNYSFSSVSGAYHLVGGILLDQPNEQRYIYLCMRKAYSSFVSISPPYPIVEAIQMTSRYARFWKGNPVGPPLHQESVPDQYCLMSVLVESPYPGAVNFKNLSIQVFHDWVAFSGEVMGDEEVNVLIEIKRIPEMVVVKTLSGTTTGRRFYLDTHLPPGEYTYEAHAYAGSSGSTGEGGGSSDSGDSEWGGIELM